jgi:hypothetical protein
MPWTTTADITNTCALRCALLSAAEIASYVPVYLHYRPQGVPYQTIFSPSAHQLNGTM